MFCRNCGNELIGVPYYCMKCGARPMAGKSFCHFCANPTTPLSEICVKCGTRLSEVTVVGTAAEPELARNKTAAVLLAVFLHFFTWLYTYKKDGWKFWTAGAVWVFMLMILAAHIGPFAWLLALVVWIWAVIDTARRPQSWYSDYHAGPAAEKTIEAADNVAHPVLRG